MDMLHVLVLILKIILWLLLGIVGLVVLGILLVLFVPVTYKVDAAYDGTAKINAKIRFLIFSVRLKFDQKTKKLEQDIRVAWFKLGKKGTRKVEETAKDTVQTILHDEIEDGNISEDEAPGDEIHISEDEASDDEIHISKDEAPGDEIVNHEISNDVTPAYPANEEYDLWNNEEESIYQDALPQEEKKLFGRIKTFFVGVCAWLKRVRAFAANFTPDKLMESIEEKLSRLNRKKRQLQKKLERLKKFWNLNCTVKTRAYLKKYLVSVLRHIRPRKVKGRVHYGFDEPYKTGQVTGYLSLMPFVYQKGLSLEPDFYNKVIEGHIYMRGHIQLGYLLRIVLNINIWRTVMVVRKLVNQE